MSHIKYRPDVDGLRAVAVILVILFHMNAEWIPGGFIGVDIFFVISGFIITSTIYPQMLAKEFSFNLFYVKRIKRILPLFYLVVVTSLIFAAWIYTPADFESFANTMRYASAFIANIYFEKHSGYFAPTSETLPLLHTWSLSIEEQFYFVWPMVLLISVKYLPKRYLIPLLTFSSVGFICYSQFLTESDPGKGYYFIQSRAFELLGGALFAIWLVNQQTKKTTNFTNQFSQVCGVIGGVGILSCAWVLDETRIFPGFNAVWVVVSTILVIYSGEVNRSLIPRVLSFKPAVLIGRLSYSLYLWHWPVLAFYRYYHLQFTIFDAAICGFITLCLSIFSWRFFETQLRHLVVKKRWVYLCYLVIPLVISVMVAKNIAKHEGYPQRFTISASKLYEAAVSSFETEKLKLPIVDGYQPFEPYQIGDSSKPISLWIWGDSHAGHFRSFIESWGQAKGFSALFGGRGGCPPLLGSDLIKYGKPEQECTQHNNQLAAVIEQKKPKFVVLAARWAMYAETTLNLGEKGSRVFLGDPSDYSESIENSRRALESGLTRTIEFLLKNQITPIIFEQIPDYPFKPSNCLIKKELYDWMSNVSCDIAVDKVESRFKYSHSIIDGIKNKYPEVRIISVEGLVCDNKQCFSQINGIPLYEDNNHLNYYGAKELGRIWVMKNPEKSSILN